MEAPCHHAWKKQLMLISYPITITVILLLVTASRTDQEIMLYLTNNIY